MMLDLPALMNGSGLSATQSDVFFERLKQYAEAMRNGSWDWRRTAGDPHDVVILDVGGCIVAGHHRFVATYMSGIEVSDGVVILMTRSTSRPRYNWEQVRVKPGFDASGVMP